MSRINIRTTLCACPPPKKHEILVITRGSTASINFNLFNKIYHMNDIEQVTFTFKQNKNIFYFDMIDYFKLTEDSTAQAGKKYFERIDSNSSWSKYKFIEKALAAGTSIDPETWYEAVDLKNNEDRLDDGNWQFDNHFTYNVGKTFEYINFIFYSSETKQLALTEPDNNMQFEVAIRLNTDHLAGLHQSDSVIIEPQHSIAVVDSLYTHI